MAVKLGLGKELMEPMRDKICTPRVAIPHTRVIFCAGISECNLAINPTLHTSLFLYRLTAG